MGRKETFSKEWSPSVEEHAIELLYRVNKLIRENNVKLESPYLTSGWRPASFNKTVVNAAPRSKHITGEAIDLFDPDGDLDEYLLSNINVLVANGLYMEPPSATKGWCHLQSVSPKSGKRIFFP